MDCIHFVPKFSFTVARRAALPGFFGVKAGAVSVWAPKMDCAGKERAKCALFVAFGGTK